ncbi:hypothetical protein MMC14_010409 [Varicellaria rhodocarpa]|nr:hypothetical protein [Varicellaria rhodocarpa]
MDSRKYQPTLTPETAEFWEGEGSLTPIQNKRRRLSSQLLTPPSSHKALSTLSSLPEGTVSLLNFSAAYVTEPIDSIEIPATLKSEETYAFLGFDEATADTLWLLYSNKSEDLPGDFFEFVKWHIENPEYDDATSGRDDWDAVMRKIGISSRLRKAILLEDSADIRLTATCKFWLVDTMWMIWRILEDLEKDLSERKGEQELAKKNRPKAGSISSAPTIPDPISQRPTTSETQPKYAIPTLAIWPSSGSTPSVATAIEAPKSMDGHTMIWRAGFRDRHRLFYDSETEAIDLTAIASVPGDFSGTRRVAYFTPQRETADRYAVWTKQKTAIVNIVVVQIAVPWTFIEPLQQQHLWFDDQQDLWRKLIWESRRGRELPKDLRFLYEKDLLIGHIASSIHSKYERMNTFTEIKEQDLLTIMVDNETKKATQWVFNTLAAADGFQIHCRGKIWFHSMGALFGPKTKVV